MPRGRGSTTVATRAHLRRYTDIAIPNGLCPPIARADLSNAEAERRFQLTEVKVMTGTVLKAEKAPVWGSSPLKLVVTLATTQASGLRWPKLTVTSSESGQ